MIRLSQECLRASLRGGRWTSIGPRAPQPISQELKKEGELFEREAQGFQSEIQGRLHSGRVHDPGAAEFSIAGYYGFYTPKRRAAAVQKAKEQVEFAKKLTRKALDEMYPGQDSITLYHGFDGPSFKKRLPNLGEGLSFTDRREIAERFSRPGGGILVAKVAKSKILYVYSISPVMQKYRPGENEYIWAGGLVDDYEIQE